MGKGVRQEGKGGCCQGTMTMSVFSVWVCARVCVGGGLPRTRQVSAAKLYAPSPTYAHLQPCQSQAQAGLPRTLQDHTEPLVLPLPAPDTESLSQSWTSAIISSVAFVVCVFAHLMWVRGVQVTRATRESTSGVQVPAGT